MARAIADHLRYFANTGGRMPRETLSACAKAAAHAPYLMYGLTEAFRSTYLPPEEVDRRPDSIGKAIPNAEILVLREDGTTVRADEPGELVHRGALVALGYWGDPKRRPSASGRCRDAKPGLVLPEIAVFSGDTVRRTRRLPVLHRPARRDDQDVRLSREPDRDRGSALRDDSSSARPPRSACPPDARAGDRGRRDAHAATDARRRTLMKECRERLPAYMVPATIDIRPDRFRAIPTARSTAKR
jgi:acyl-CoA synthetase (AMP-forming)/AMP-acid ligase II